MKNFLSRRVLNLAPSETFVMAARAKAMKKEGIEVIDFSVGEPDFDTPEYIKKAAIEALKKGKTKYTPASGTLELREAIARKFWEDNKIKYEPENIIVSTGAKHSLYNIFQAICEEGDEVIIPEPYWVSYPPQVALAGGKSVFIKTSLEEGFKIKPGQFKKKITARTKAIIINSPSNPTGAVYTRKELEEIAEIAVEKDILLISDEVYEKIIYDGAIHFSPASFHKEIFNRTITVNALSKAYAMTGWRIGYAAGPSEIIKACGRLQSQSTSNPTSISQEAGVAALGDGKEEIKKMVVEFKKRRDYILERLKKIDRLMAYKPEGAFYVFPKVKEIYSLGFKGSSDLAQAVLEKAQVALVAGAPFGDDESIRISYATSLENIVKGMDRLEGFF